MQSPLLELKQAALTGLSISLCVCFDRGSIMLRTMACLFILLWIGSEGAIVTGLQFSYNNKGVWSATNNGLPKVAGKEKDGDFAIATVLPPSLHPPQFLKLEGGGSV